MSQTEMKNEKRLALAESVNLISFVFDAHLDDISYFFAVHLVYGLSLLDRKKTVWKLILCAI